MMHKGTDENLEEALDTNAKDNGSIEESMDEDSDYSEEEIIENSMIAIDKLDESITNLYLDPNFFEVIEKLRSENYNKLTITERRELLNTLHSVACCFFQEAMEEGLYISDTLLENKEMDFIDGKLYVYNEIFKAKNSGLTIFSEYLYTLKKHLTLTLIEALYECNFDDNKLKGLTRIYYENMAESILYNSWRNHLNEHEKNYSKQPIIFDSSKLSKDMIFKIIKIFYNKYHIIDKEMSSLLYQHMAFYNNFDENIKIRKEIIAKNRNNIRNVKEEMKNYKRYLKVTCSDVSKLSDQEFYELFNKSYFNALNIDDGHIEARLTNLTNELMNRQFKDFDLTNITLPKYSFKYNEEEFTMTMTRIYDSHRESMNISTSNDALSMAIQDMSVVAQYNKLFKFNNEKEKKDYLDMVLWCDLKNHDYSSPSDSEIVKDGLNIILQKVNEMYANLYKKINDAVNVSSFTPHGGSMINHDSNDAYYDYHEFKNGYTRQEVSDAIMEYIREDIEKMKKGGR